MSDSLSRMLDLTASSTSQQALLQSQDLPDDPWKIQNNSFAGTSTSASALAGASLPASFNEIFQSILPNSEDKITVAALDKVILSSGLPKATSSKILYMVLGMNQTHISREEFFVILGLIALAQKNMDVTMDSLQLYKNDLPDPSLPGLENVDFRSLRGRDPSTPQNNFNDPWRSSKLTGHLSGIGGGADSSKYVTLSIGRSQGTRGSHRLNVPPPHIPDDIIEVKEAPELGGLIFKFVNYTVVSKVRGCSVLRRYSDFDWLYEVLHKRYPYRMLPKLPPKKFGGNKSFFDERRVGLARFVNFLAVHPKLKEDSLFNAFLTETTDIATYRRDNKIHSFEELEFAGPNQALDHISSDAIQARVVKAQQCIEQAARQHEKICLALERMRARQQVSSKDYLLYSQALSSLAEQEMACPNEDCLPCPQVFTQFGEIANYLQKVSVLMNDSAEEPFLEVVEGFRRHNLLLIGLQDLFARVKGIKHPDTEAIRARLDATRAKLEGLVDQPSQAVEAQRLQQAVETEERNINEQEKRGRFLNHCLWEEMDYFHNRHIQTRELYQRFINLELDHNMQVSRVWKQLSVVVDSLPSLGPSTTLATPTTNVNSIGGQ